MQKQLFGSGASFRKLLTNPHDVLRIAKMVEYLIDQDASRQPPHLTTNVVSLNDYRRRIEGANVVADTVFSLAEVIGRKTVVLLYIVGFKTLADLANASPIALSSLPNIGPVRFKKICDFLETRGYEIKTIDALDSGYASVRDSFQLEFTFTTSLYDVACSGRESL